MFGFRTVRGGGSFQLDQFVQRSGQVRKCAGISFVIAACSGVSQTPFNLGDLPLDERRQTFTQGRRICTARCSFLPGCLLCFISQRPAFTPGMRHDLLNREPIFICDNRKFYICLIDLCDVRPVNGFGFCRFR